MKCLPSIAVFAFAWSAAAAHAQLVTLHDAGTGVPLEPYTHQMLSGDDQSGQHRGWRYPLQSPLQAGVLELDGIALYQPKWLTRNIAVVGTDTQSMQWLAFNHARLKQVDAFIAVVRSDSAKALEPVKQVAQGLSVAEVADPLFSEQLQGAGVGVYPVLIHNNGHVYQRLGGLP
ncbi:DUF2859 domain-containing protein [Lampropedia puyangensis]|uniref:DUF2859 domain-containing protein n=1 Tax=Lampropedia puyangensis TaxID=1330072 RepID=A0A4S8EU33_9BURK|nr:DUF2859 domain-containing protein [Lampropedia puyangensis]THT98399.1 DUF2859 domain-containing protein [Lampropedia puyangensis]